ncbi:MAG: MBL fold metallo-hydrolase, partial [Candidatus Limnocylindrales bacterium]
RELLESGVAIKRIVFTHGDPDHIGGSDHLRRAFGAEVCAPIADRPLIDRSGWSRLPRLRWLLLRTFFRRTPAPAVDRWIDAEGSLDGLEIVPTPGHTPGHICLDWNGWLIAGDAFRSGDRFSESPWPFTMDRSTARASIETLLARSPIGASSSHGRPQDNATERLQALVDSWS